MSCLSPSVHVVSDLWGVGCGCERNGGCDGSGEEIDSGGLYCFGKYEVPDHNLFVQEYLCLVEEGWCNR